MSATAVDHAKRAVQVGEYRRVTAAHVGEVVAGLARDVELQRHVVEQGASNVAMLMRAEMIDGAIAHLMEAMDR